MKHFFWVWPEETIPYDTCDKWVSRYKDKVETGAVTASSVIDFNIRRSSTCFPTEPDVRDLAANYLHLANRNAFGVDIGYHIECQFAAYKSDNAGCYKWHMDSAPASHTAALDRKLTMVALLSDPSDFTGGEFMLQGADELPKLGKGSVLVFPSFISHQVTPVVEGERFSMVAWAEGPPWR
jgi:PKHD-type hydroxylase